MSEKRILVLRQNLALRNCRTAAHLLLPLFREIITNFFFRKQSVGLSAFCPLYEKISSLFRASLLTTEHFEICQKWVQKSSKSVSDLLLHVPLWGGGYSVVNNKRGRQHFGLSSSWLLISKARRGCQRWAKPIHLPLTGSAGFAIQQKSGIVMQLNVCCFTVHEHSAETPSTNETFVRNKP